MGRWYFHSTEAVQSMIAREEWLGCRHDASPMFDIPGSTPVWVQYIIFWFLIYKNLCICILLSKSICSIKEHWWSLALSWSDEVQRKFLTTQVFTLHRPAYLALSFFIYFVFVFSLLTSSKKKKKKSKEQRREKDKSEREKKSKENLQKKKREANEEGISPNSKNSSEFRSKRDFL